MATPKEIPARVNCSLTVTASAGDPFLGRLYITSILKSGNVTIDGVVSTVGGPVELFSPIVCTTFTASSLGQVSYYGGPAGSFCNSWSADFASTDFFSVSSVANIGGSGGASDKFTISLWLYMNSAHTAPLIGGHNSTNSALKVSAGREVIWVDDVGVHLFASALVPVSTWTNVIIQSDGSTTLSVYIDGALADSSSGTVGEAEVRYVGTANFTGVRNYYQGKMDEVAIWRGATQPTAASIYNGATPGDLTASNPDNWWRMGDDDSPTDGVAIGGVTDIGSLNYALTQSNVPQRPTWSTSVP